MAPILKGLFFANPEGSLFRQSGRVPISETHKGFENANPEGPLLRQPGKVPFSPNQNGQLRNLLPYTNGYVDPEV